MSNRRHGEFKKGFKPDGSRPSPGQKGVNSGSHMQESSTSKPVGYPHHGGTSVGFTPHGKKVKQHPDGTI